MAELKNTTISDTGFLQLPTGTTAQRPGSGSAGQMRFNTDTRGVEWYDDEYNSWFPVGVVSPIATGGSVTNVTQGGISYRVHTFTSVGSSTLTVTRGGQVEFLIVAGGGSGAGGIGAGGGAGGLLTGTTSVTPQAYVVTVGDGGAPAIGGSSQTGIAGNNGENSSALGFTAIGGGHGGRHREGNNDGTSGGSGGGAGANGSRVGGAGTPGQGNKGGDVVIGDSPNWATGGGGGAGFPGQDIQDSRTDPGGNGGAGISSLIEGTNYFYAGGGGGGVHTGSAGAGNGGLGGGGGGAATSGPFGIGGPGRSSGQDGSTGGGTDGGNGGTNTGGGGGGGAWDQTFGGAGGAGIVIIRYRTSGA